MRRAVLFGLLGCAAASEHGADTLMQKFCLTPVEESPGRAWALSSEEDVEGDGELLQHFELDFMVGTDANDGSKPLATFEFVEPVVLTGIGGGGRAVITKCDSATCLDAALGGGTHCLSWCNPWTCSSPDCIDCGKAVGCHAPPSPPTPAPPPHPPGLHGITLSILGVEEWERQRQQGGAGGKDPEYEQSQLQRKVFGSHQRANGPGLVEVRRPRRPREAPIPARLRLGAPCTATSCKRTPSFDATRLVPS